MWTSGPTSNLTPTPRFGPQASMSKYVNFHHFSLSFTPNKQNANTYSSLFALLKGEVVEIVDFALDHHKRTGNAPTLAVNASSWWYANLSAKGVQEIRNRMNSCCYKKIPNANMSCFTAESGVDANPSESSILFYTLRILELGIRLHFVFDGPTRLHNGGKAHPGYDPPSQLLRDTFTQLAIPWHDAPGEAEAECAKMEMEGLADAVWSEDGDAFAFGCQTLIRFYREIKLSTIKDQGSKSYTDFRVYSLQKIATEHPGMTRAGFILNAVLKGGVNGSLANLTPRDLLEAARAGLGTSLEMASKSDLDFWRWVDSGLGGFLKDLGRYTEILGDAPSYAHIKDYTTPVVSTRETLLGFDLVEDTFDEYESFKFLSKSFQWNIKQWAQYIIPLRVVRALLATRVGEESQHDHLKFKCDLKKKSKKVKAEFLVSAATSLDLPNEMEKIHHISTPTWIIRKARVNGVSTITSFFTTPQSGRASASGKRASRSDDFTAIGNTASPSQFRGTNGEGSFRREPVRQRQITPPSPTPTQRFHNVASQLGASTSKNIRPAVIEEQGNIGSAKGKGKAKGIPTVPKADSKKKRSAPKAEESRNKKARVEIDLTLSSAESSNKESDCDLTMPQSSEEFGSAPATQDLQELPALAAASKAVVTVDTSDSDDFGSVPSSPDLLALLDP